MPRLARDLPGIDESERMLCKASKNVYDNLCDIAAALADNI